MTPVAPRVVVVLGYSDRGRDEIHPVCAARLARAGELTTRDDVVVLSGWARVPGTRSAAGAERAAAATTRARGVRHAPIAPGGLVTSSIRTSSWRRSHPNAASRPSVHARRTSRSRPLPALTRPDVVQRVGGVADRRPCIGLDDHLACGAVSRRLRISSASERVPGTRAQPESTTTSSRRARARQREQAALRRSGGSRRPPPFRIAEHDDDPGAPGITTCGDGASRRRAASRPP